MTKAMKNGKFDHSTNSNSKASKEVQMVKIVHRNKLVISNSKIPLNVPTNLNVGPQKVKIVYFYLLFLSVLSSDLNSTVSYPKSLRLKNFFISTWFSTHLPFIAFKMFTSFIMDSANEMSNQLKPTDKQIVAMIPRKFPNADTYSNVMAIK